MRPTIVLLSPPGDHHRLADRLRGAGNYSRSSYFDQVLVGSCRFGVCFSGRVLVEFDEEEIEEVRARIGEFQAILLEYGSPECLRRLLTRVLPGLRGVLDTNFGEFLDYADVCDRFAVDPAWDWRVAGPTETSGPGL